MALHVKCPHCGKRLRAPEDRAGKKARCSDCKTSFRITPEYIRQAAHPQSSSNAPNAPAETPLSEWFMLGADERQYGPVSRETLQKWFEEGRIDANCQVYQRGWPAWKWADDEFPELAAESTPPPPPENQSPPPAVSAPPNPAGSTTNLVVSREGTPTETNSLKSLDTLPVWGDIRRDLRRRVSHTRIAAIAAVFLAVAAIAGGGLLIAQNWSGGLNRSVLIGAALCISGLLGGLPVIWAMLSQAASLSQLTRNATTAQWRTSTRGDARLWKTVALSTWLVFLLTIAVAALVLAIDRGHLPS